MTLRSTTMEVCFDARKAIYARECEIADLSALLRAIRKNEALLLFRRLETVDEPCAFAVYGPGKDGARRWRALLPATHPIWHARVIYATVVGGRIGDIGATRCLRRRVRTSHERLRQIAERHKDWVIYAIPVRMTEDDNVFHGMFSPPIVQTEYRSGRFTPAGEFKDVRDECVLRAAVYAEIMRSTLINKAQKRYPHDAIFRPSQGSA